jgi:translation initiation factor IF-3
VAKQVLWICSILDLRTPIELVGVYVFPTFLNRSGENLLHRTTDTRAILSTLSLDHFGLSRVFVNWGPCVRRIGQLGAFHFLGGTIPERSFRQSDRTRVNERIRAREVRVIDEQGAQLGVMQPYEAVRLARERGLDLVEISPTADPPVCKITDYGKFLYQQNKQAHQQRKSSRGSQLKEVKFRPATAEHDYQVRKNQIIRFLGEGHKVRAMIFHRGREMAHQEVGRAKMTRLLGEIGEFGQIETMPRMEGNVLVALLAPKKGAGVTRSAPQPSASA